MKLKKIASLALAGLMAVSMLAGCGDNSSNNNTTVVPGTSSVVSAVNDGQNANNKVKITFTSSTVLENAINTLVADNGDKVLTSGNFAGAMPKLTGETYGTAVWSDTNTPSASGKQVLLYANALTALNKDAALKMVANKVDETVKDLVKTTYDEDTYRAGNTFYNYSYEGEIALVSATNTTNVTTWYYAFTITQNAEAKKLDK